MTEIELPDGTILEAPDGLSPAQIKSIVQKHKGASAPQASAPDGSSGGLLGAAKALAGGFGAGVDVATNAFGLKPVVEGALGASLGIGGDSLYGGDWGDRYRNLKTAADERYDQNRKSLSQAAEATVLPQGWGDVVPNTIGGAGDAALATAALPAGIIAPASTKLARDGASLLARAAGGIGDAALLGAESGAIKASGHEYDNAGEFGAQFGGALGGAINPWNLMGAAAPVMGGLAKSAPGYRDAAKQYASEALRVSGDKAYTALERRFGTGKGTGLTNAGQALLDATDAQGRTIVTPEATPASASSALEGVRTGWGALKDRFLKASPAKVDGQGVNADVREVLQEFTEHPLAKADPGHAAQLRRLTSWAEGIMGELGLNFEGVLTPGKGVARASNLKPGPAVTEPGYDALGNKARIPTVDDPGMVGQRRNSGVAGVKPRLKKDLTTPRPNGERPVIKEVPVLTVDRFKTALDKYIEGYTAKYANPGAVAATDPVLGALYRIRGKLNARVEDAIGGRVLGPDGKPMLKDAKGNDIPLKNARDLAIFKMLKGEFSKAKVLDEVMADASKAADLEKANPTGRPDAAAMLEGAVRPFGWAHDARAILATMSRPAADLLTRYEPLKKAATLRNRANWLESGEKFTDFGLEKLDLSPGTMRALKNIDMPPQLLQAIIQALRNKNTKDDYAP